MSTSSTFDKRVYPIKGSIRFEFDDIENLEGERYSTPVKVGKYDWRLHITNTEEVDPKCLSVHLECLTELEQEDFIDVEHTYCLLNQSELGKKVFRKETSYLDENSDSWGFSKFIKWRKLLSSGYVKNGKIVVVCDISINSENVKRGKIDFEQERPNEMDLKNILEVKSPLKIEQFKEEFLVSEISEQTHFSDPVTVFGLPAKVGVKKWKEDGEDFLSLFVYLNNDDESDWWRCKLQTTVTLVNQTKTKKNFSESFLYTYGKNSNFEENWFIDWSELVDPSNGYVKDGKIKLKISLQMFEMYGFDKNTRRGIDMPMRNMTDAVLTVGDKKLHVCKKILAQQSSYFTNLFSSNPEENVFELEDVQLDDFKRFLELVHNVDTDVYEENVEALLGLIHTYKAPECYERLDSIVKNLEFEDTMEVLELVDKHPLPKLRNKFLLKMKDEELLKSITHSPRYKTLSDKMKVAILEWKLIPEESKTEDVEPASYQFSTDFDDESDMTDIKINVNDYNYYASKQILANASHFFMKKFYGPYSEDTSEVCVFDVTPREFEKLLTHIYHPTRPVTSANIISLLKLAHKFFVPRLMDKCEEYLVINDNISLIDKLEYAGMFYLPYLLESCLKASDSDEATRELASNSKFFYLNSKIHRELMKRRYNTENVIDDDSDSDSDSD